MRVIEQFLKSNREFWGKHPPCTSDAGCALIDASINEPFILYGVLKVGLIFAKIHGLRPIAFPYLSTRSIDIPMIESMCAHSVHARRTLLEQLILKFYSIFRIVLSIKSPDDILKIAINSVPVGPYIYDQCYVPGAKTVTLRMYARIFYAALCFYMDEAAIKKHDVKLVIIGDPIYRGFLFEICKARNIKCINAINVGIFQMHKYYDLEEFENCWRFVSAGMIDKLGESTKTLAYIDDYFNKRLSGTIKSHDVLRAYSPEKRNLSKEELFLEYALDLNKPLVVVMAHCFRDSPHGLPKLLYRDYEEWIIRTVKSLKANTHVNVLIKEHPAHDLYEEQGFLKSILESLGMDNALLKNDIHTRSVIDGGDIFITCGGTIGVEAAAFGKLVVIAAKPPYAQKGFTVEPNCIAEYESILSQTLHMLPPLSSAQILAAKKTAYILLSLYDNSNTGMELGGIQYVLGEQYDIQEVYKNVIDENRRPLEEQKIYTRLLEFHQSEDVSIINYDKLLAVEAPAI